MLALYPVFAAQDKPKKQAVSARGNSAEQTVTVDAPYCDVYWPYSFDAASQTFTNFGGNDNAQQTVRGIQGGSVSAGDAAFQAAYQQVQKERVSDSIDWKKGFSDPGFPILGSPGHHFYTDGSDLTRLLYRLSGPAAGQPGPIPLCKGTPTQPAGPALSDMRKLQYFLVHIVHWKYEDSKYTYDPAKSEWYMFNMSDKKEPPAISIYL